MANKNTAGNRYYQCQVREDRIIDRIDRREKKSENLENVDNTYNNYQLNDNGDRCWSF